MKIPTLQQIKTVYEKNKYTLFTDKLNIIGIRSNDLKPNTFNDLILLVWQADGAWNVSAFEATTDPGTYWLMNPMNPKGTFIMAPGQYIDSHCLGLHKGYEALVQCGKLKGWRDNDKDNQYDMIPENLVEIGLCGVDIHHAGQNSTQVDKWSAACQVIAKLTNWIIFLNIVKAWSKKQNKFTYTLLLESEII